MERYVIRRGPEEYARLKLLARARWPDTSDLLERVGNDAALWSDFPSDLESDFTASAAEVEAMHTRLDVLGRHSAAEIERLLVQVDAKPGIPGCERQ